MRIISAASLVAGLVAGTAAFAQSATTTPAPVAPAPMAAPAAPMAGGMRMGTAGMTTATSATVDVKFIGVQPTDTVSSRIRGASVYNASNEKLGEIEDFVITDGRTISGVILGVGGFLGLGERYVAVEPSALTLVKDGSGYKAMLNTTKDDLNNAPKFDYSRAKS